MTGDETGAGGLKLRGLLVDSIELVTDFVDRRSSNGEFDILWHHNRIRAPFDNWLRLGRSIYLDNKDAFARLLLMDDTYTGSCAILFSSPIFNPASTYRSAVNSWQVGKSGRMNGRKMDTVQTFQMQAATTCHRRSFAITRNGYIASTPPIAKPGDVVVVFFGATVPYVLRPQQGGYLLVGDAFVQGLMKGEALLRPDLRPLDITLV